MQARIRIINKFHHVECFWLSDDNISYALGVLDDMQQEEPRMGWKVQVCGDTMNWHDYEGVSI